MSEKAESVRDKKLFYVFVSLNEGKTRPDYFIFPSSHVARFVRKNHEKWLNTPGKRGQKHNPNKVRHWRDEENKYLERWELLGLDGN